MKLVQFFFFFFFFFLSAFYDPIITNFTIGFGKEKKKFVFESLISKSDVITSHEMQSFHLEII
jgi:hypothetical protein